MTSIRRRVRQRLTRVASPDGERGSMAILLMVVLVGMVLSAMIVPVIITQDRTTKFDTTRVQALNAAESGIDVTLGLIRSSVTAATNIGDSKLLPCSPMDPATGSPGVAVSGFANSVGIAKYDVVIEYFMIDPVAEVYPSRPYQSKYSTNSGNSLMCSSGYGPYQSGSGGGPVTPKFARLTSKGTVGAAVNGSTAGRTLTSTYKFKTSDTNFLGGVIRVNLPGDALCMDVGTATPVAGVAVTLQKCSTSNPPAPQQVFAYRTDLTLQLASTAPSNGMNGCDPTIPTSVGSV